MILGGTQRFIVNHSDRLTDVFWKGPDSNYFWFCGWYVFSPLLSPVMEWDCSCRHHVNKAVWPFPSSFIDERGNVYSVSLSCSTNSSLGILFFFWGFFHLNNVKARLNLQAIPKAAGGTDRACGLGIVNPWPRRSREHSNPMRRRQLRGRGYKNIQELPAVVKIKFLKH